MPRHGMDVRASRPALAIAAARSAASRRTGSVTSARTHRRPPVEARAAPESAETSISTCCACWLPSQTTSSRLAVTRTRRSRRRCWRRRRRRPGAPGSWPRAGDRRERQRKARAPQDRAGQDDPDAADEIELEVEPRVGRDRRIDRPVRQRLRAACMPPRRSRRRAASGTSRARAAGARCVRAMAEPMLLPMPRPNRKTARISENV